MTSSARSRAGSSTRSQVSTGSCTTFRRSRPQPSNGNSPGLTRPASSEASARASWPPLPTNPAQHVATTVDQQHAAGSRSPPEIPVADRKYGRHGGDRDDGNEERSPGMISPPGNGETQEDGPGSEERVGRR